MRPRSIGSIRRSPREMAEYGMKLAEPGIKLQRPLAHLYFLDNNRTEAHKGRDKILAPSATTLNGRSALLI